MNGRAVYLLNIVACVLFFVGGKTFAAVEEFVEMALFEVLEYDPEVGYKKRACD